MSGGMVPLPVLPVKAPFPNSCTSPTKSFGCHTSGKSLQSSALSNANAPATPLDSISKYANSFGICTSKHAPKSTAINPFESMPLSPKLFPCHTSAKCARNSFPCHTSKITIPQALCLPHIRDPHRAPAAASWHQSDLFRPVFPVFQAVPTFRIRRTFPPARSLPLGKTRFVILEPKRGLANRDETSRSESTRLNSSHV